VTDRPSRKLFHNMHLLLQPLIMHAANGGEEPTGVGFVTSGTTETEAYWKLVGNIQNCRH